jgi:hypothetical protein
MKQSKELEIAAVMVLLSIILIFALIIFVTFHSPTAPSNQPYAFNLTACTTNPTPQYCGIPNGQVCGVENNNSTNATVLVCLDYWLSPNGKQVILSNTQNVQTVLSNLP